MEHVLAEALELVRPSEEESHLIGEASSELITKFSDGLRRRGFEDIEVTLQGSVAHGTWLPGSRDIDIFMIIPRNRGVEFIKSGKALQLLAEIATENGIPWSTRYAQHPYLTLKYRGFQVDVVPCMKISLGEKPLTATDRSPLHTLYLMDKLRGKENEVRLLKAFMRVGGIYGAEIGVGGFSGYLTELLVVIHGSFLGVLEAAKSWRPHQTVLDPGKHYASPSAARRIFSSPLIVVDPVDASRNAAAAVTEEAMSTFIAMAHIFMLSPGLQFFKGGEPSPAFSPLLVLLMPYPNNGPPDTVWGQLRRASSSLSNVLSAAGFTVYRSGEWTDEETLAAVFIALESLGLSPLSLMRGPLVYAPESIEFLRKHMNASMGPFIVGTHWFAVEKRKIMDAAEAVKMELPRMPAPLRSASIIKIRNENELSSLPKNLEKAIRKFLSKPSWLSAIPPKGDASTTVPKDK
ncbi:MAG: CCA tRNA nucleotidyltransferase [Thermocladium sp.]